MRENKSIISDMKGKSQKSLKGLNEIIMDMLFICPTK